MSILKDIRFYIAIAIIVGGILVYLNLPKRVTKNEDNIQTLTSNVDKFVVEQRTIQKEQNKREELMLELIKIK